MRKRYCAMGILIAGPKVIQTTPLTNPTVSKKGHFSREKIRSDYVGSNPFQSFNILYGIVRKVWGFVFSDLAAVVQNSGILGGFLGRKM